MYTNRCLKQQNLQLGTVHNLHRLQYILERGAHHNCQLTVILYRRIFIINSTTGHHHEIMFFYTLIRQLFICIVNTTMQIFRIFAKMFRNFHRFRVNPTTHITLASAWSLICPIDGLYRDNSLTVGTHTLLEILTDDAMAQLYVTKLLTISLYIFD